MKQRALGALVVAGTLTALLSGGALPAHAAATLRDPLHQVGGEDPSAPGALTPASAEIRWQDPVRRVTITEMDPARFPVSVAGVAGPPCTATLAVGDLHGAAPLAVLPSGNTEAVLQDNKPGAVGQLASIDVVCDWTDPGGVVQHHETHWAGQFGTSPVAVIPSSVPYGALKTGTSATTDVVLRSAGNLPLHISSVTIAGDAAADFALVSNACANATLNPSATCTVSVRFAPTTSGPRTAALVFSDDAPGGSQRTALTGTGLQPFVAVDPVRVSFGFAPVLVETRDRTVTLTSTGNEDLVFGTLTINGDPDFTIVSDGCSNRRLVPGRTCQVTIRWRALFIGQRNADLVLPSNAPTDAPHAATMIGIANLPAGV